MHIYAWARNCCYMSQLHCEPPQLCCNPPRPNCDPPRSATMHPGSTATCPGSAKTSNNSTSTHLSLATTTGHPGASNTHPAATAGGCATYLMTGLPSVAALSSLQYQRLGGGYCIMLEQRLLWYYCSGHGRLAGQSQK